MVGQMNHFLSVICYLDSSSSKYCHLRHTLSCDCNVCVARTQDYWAIQAKETSFINISVESDVKHHSPYPTHLCKFDND